MANDLLDPLKKDEEENLFDPNKNAAQEDYDQKFNEIVGSPENKAFGDQAEAAARDNEFGYSPDADRRNLADQESSGRATDQSTPNKDETNAVNNASKNNMSQKSDNNKPWFKGLLSSNKARGGLLSGGIIGVLIGGFTAVQPFQIVHFMMTMSEIHLSRGEEQSETSLRRTYNTITQQREKNSLGALGSMLAQKNRSSLIKQGFDLSFTPPEGRLGRSTLQYIDVPDGPDGDRILSMARDSGMDIDPGNSRRIHTRGTRNFKGLRVVSKELAKIGNNSKKAGWLKTRRFRKLVGANFSPMNLAKRATESVFDHRKRVLDTRAKEIKTGVPQNNIGNALVEGEDGNDTVTDSDEGNSRRESVDDVNKTDSAFDRKTKIKLFKVGSTATAIVSVACAVKDLGNGLSEYKMTSTLGPMLRLFWTTMSVGSKVMTGTVTADEVGVVTSQLFDPETGASAFAAASIKQPLGGEGGTPADTDMASAASSVLDGSENKPQIFKVLDDIPGLGTACRADSWVASLPGVSHFNNFVGGITNKLVEFGTGKDTDEWMQQLIATLAGDTIDLVAMGPDFGNIMSYAGRLTQAVGGVFEGGESLTVAQTLEWRNHQRDIRLVEKKYEPILSRTLNPNKTDSLLSMAVLGNPDLANHKTVLSAIKSKPLGLLSSLSEFAGVSVNKTYAQTINANAYDFGIPEIGIPLSNFTEKYSDEYEEIDYFESNNFTNLKAANQRYGKCYGNKITDEGRINDELLSEVEVFDNMRSSECKENTELKERYKTYISSNVSIKSAACYSLSDAELNDVYPSACEELGLTSSGSNSSSGLSAEVGEISEDSSAIPCAQGTDDLGIRDDAYSKGQRLRIRLCGINSISGPGMGNQSNAEVGSGKPMVSSIFSDAWQKLGEAFEADNGRKLAVGSSWRTYAHQQILYDRASKPGVSAASPGHSNHQTGAALDISDIYTSVNGEIKSGATCSNPQLSNTVTYRWMVENAKRFGIKNYAVEAWHWGPLESCEL